MSMSLQPAVWAPIMLASNGLPQIAPAVRYCHAFSVFIWRAGIAKLSVGCNDMCISVCGPCPLHPNMSVVLHICPDVILLYFMAQAVHATLGISTKGNFLWPDCGHLLAHGGYLIGCLVCRRASVGEDTIGCIKLIKDALSECSIKQRLRWQEKLSAAVPDAWASLKADITLFQADDTVKEALLG